MCSLIFFVLLLQDAFTGNAAGCVSLPGFDGGTEYKFRDALGAALDAGVAVTFYFGKNDRACNYVGGLEVAKSLQWSGSSAFLSAPMLPFLIAGAEAGQVGNRAPATAMSRWPLCSANHTCNVSLVATLLCQSHLQCLADHFALPITLAGCRCSSTVS